MFFIFFFTPHFFSVFRKTFIFYDEHALLLNQKKINGFLLSQII